MTVPGTPLGNLAQGSFLRVVNYHNTPFSRVDEYAAQLASYARSHRSVTIDDLDQLATTGRWPHDRPGLIPVFFEGYRSNLDVALPLLEELGLVGWFYVPSAFHAVPVADQRAFAEAHSIGLVDGDPGPRYSMTADEIRRVADGHVIAAHTATHEQMGKILTDEDIEREIVEPKRTLERLCGRPVDVFAWLYAERHGLYGQCDAALRSAGYRYVTSHARIQKIA